MSTDPASLYSRKNPFPAAHSVNRQLSGAGSEKETRHHEISLAGSGLAYEVGDSLGVFASNDPSLVLEIVKAIAKMGVQGGGLEGAPRQMISIEKVVVSN